MKRILASILILASLAVLAGCASPSSVEWRSHIQSPYRPDTKPVTFDEKVAILVDVEAPEMGYGKNFEEGFRQAATEEMSKYFTKPIFKTGAGEHFVISTKVKIQFHERYPPGTGDHNVEADYAILDTTTNKIIVNKGWEWKISGGMIGREQLFFKNVISQFVTLVLPTFKQRELNRREEALNLQRAKNEVCIDQGKSFESNGQLRKALEIYKSCLTQIEQWSAQDIKLRGYIINLVHRMDPPPAIPEEARKHAVYADTALKSATYDNRKGFDDAIREYEEALIIAPWWAGAYLNLGIVYGNAENYEAAIRSLKLYLIASPGAPDAQAVQNKIYEFEYKLKALPEKTRQ